MWFALEEKSIPYDTVLINLQDKTEWFRKMVPTQLVPAVKINGELVYESYDIMMVGCADCSRGHSYCIPAALACTVLMHSARQIAAFVSHCPPGCIMHRRDSKTLPDAQTVMFMSAMLGCSKLEGSAASWCWDPLRLNCLPEPHSGMGKAASGPSAAP